jgi:hypothetical protein
MARQGSWERKIWEDVANLIKTDVDGNAAIKVSFEDDPSDSTLDPVELQRIQLEVSLEILKQLKLMNIHLSHLSDQRVLLEDIEEFKT